jgi:predicted kinase
MLPRQSSATAPTWGRWQDARVRAVLTVVGGLPASGKSTIAAILARQTSTPYLRVDRIEQAIVAWSTLTHPVGPVGYAVAHAIAAEQLQLGQDVLVECVNPSAITRDGWVGTATAADAGLVEVEVTCSDPDEHRRRVTERPSDVEGLVKPDWAAVATRDYEPWSRDHLVIDSAVTAPEVAAERIAQAVATAR